MKIRIYYSPRFDEVYFTYITKIFPWDDRTVKVIDFSNGSWFVDDEYSVFVGYL